MLGLAIRDAGIPISGLVALARAADDAGYASLWAPEVGSRDAIFLAGMYGANTARITVGSGVVPVYSRNIAALSLSVATAAEASGGRFVLGLGAGHRFPAERWFDTEWHAPRQRMRETIEVLRQVLAGERVDHDGAFTLEGFHLGSSPPPVPVYLAALTPASLRLAGEVADGAILNWLPPEGIEKAELLVREAAADAGRRCEIVSYVRTAVVEDPAQEHTARMALREQTYAYLSLPVYANSVRNVGLGPQVDDVHAGKEPALDELVDRLCAWGTVDRVQAKLGSFDAAGLDSVIVYPVAYGDDPTGSIMTTLKAAIAG